MNDVLKNIQNRRRALWPCGGHCIDEDGSVQSFTGLKTTKVSECRPNMKPGVPFWLS